MIPQPPEVNPQPAPGIPQPTQDMPPPAPEILQPETQGAEPALRSSAGYGLEAESLPGELTEDISGATDALLLGPTAVSNVRFLMDNLGLENWLGGPGIRTFGWVEGGYTGASTGSGLLSVEPRQNRFGDEFLLNQIGLAIQKPLREDQWDLGFNIRYFAGADAALGQPKAASTTRVGDSHFGQDFRDLYLSAHLPIITDGGVDFKIGRMNTIIGYNGFLAPYRPFYSSDYQFFYSQDGAFTGFLTDLHVNNRLDIWNGMTLGANTFFTLRSRDSYCYIGQINYWLHDEKRTRLTASVYCRSARPLCRPGARQARTTRWWSFASSKTGARASLRCSSRTWDGTPILRVGTGSWYGLYLISIYHMSTQVDLLCRAEWFDDVKGTRTGVDTNYSEVTLGFNWHPFKCLEIRPEIRGDFAGAAAFGTDGTHVAHSQLSGGISVLLKF